MKYLIQKNCPDFVAPALLPNGKFTETFHLNEYVGEGYGVIFFFPLAFNYISQTEIISIQRRLHRFTALNAKVVAVSCDSHLAQRVWQTMPVHGGGVGSIGFPMVSDMTHQIARLFDVLVAEAMPEAATIVVDPEGKVILQLRHDTAVGRNIERVLEGIATFYDSSRAPSSPVEQILLVEKNAEQFKKLGYNIVAQSMDTGINDPQWQGLPHDSEGHIKLSFPFSDHEHEWPKHTGMTIAIREGLAYHSTGLLIPDGQLLFEYHSDRQVPRDFTEMLRIADAVKKHFETGEVIPWEKS